MRSKVITKLARKSIEADRMAEAIALRKFILLLPRRILIWGSLACTIYLYTQF